MRKEQATFKRRSQKWHVEINAMLNQVNLKRLSMIQADCGKKCANGNGAISQTDALFIVRLWEKWDTPHNLASDSPGMPRLAIFKVPVLEGLSETVSREAIRNSSADCFANLCICPDLQIILEHVGKTKPSNAGGSLTINASDIPVPSPPACHKALLWARPQKCQVQQRLLHDSTWTSNMFNTPQKSTQATEGEKCIEKCGLIWTLLKRQVLKGWTFSTRLQ